MLGGLVVENGVDVPDLVRHVLQDGLIVERLMGLLGAQLVRIQSELETDGLALAGLLPLVATFYELAPPRHLTG